MKATINDKVYVFTAWGLCKGRIVKERTDKFTGVPQYKVNIDIDRDNKDKDYNFWYTTGQLNKFYFTASVLEMFKPFGWFVKSLFKK
jgi:hypothetical protein